MSPRSNKTSSSRPSASKSRQDRVSSRASSINRSTERNAKTHGTMKEKVTAEAVKTSTSQKSIKISNPFKSLSPEKQTLLKKILVWTLIVFGTLILVDYAVQYLNYKASVAIVNGERLYRSDFYDRLEESYGTVIASNMIDEALIYQEAKKKDVKISDEDIEKELKDLETQYGGKEALQQELDARNITDERLRHQIETTLIIEKILTSKIKLSEDELKEFYEQYKDVLFTEDPVPSYEEAKETVKERLREQKLSTEVQTWIQELRADASIKNNIEEPKNYGFLMITRTFIDEAFNGEDK